MKDKILFINAVNEVVRKNAESKLEPHHIKKISNAFFEKKDVEFFCKVVDKQTVLDNGSNMTISLYAMPKIEREEVLVLEDSFSLWNKQSIEMNQGIANLINML